MQTRRAWTVGAPPKKRGAGSVSQPPQDFREPENRDCDFVFEAVLANDRVLNLVNHFWYLLSLSDYTIPQVRDFVKYFFIFFARATGPIRGQG